MDNDNKDDELRLLSFSEAAKRMKIGKNNLYKLISEGKIGFIKVGERNKIAVREIIKYLEENTVRVQYQEMEHKETVKHIYKSPDEIFYDIYEEHFGKVHPGRLRKLRAAEKAKKERDKK